MLTIFGKPHRRGGFCDGHTRRDFLTIGGSILGGLALPDLLKAETTPGASSGSTAQHKAIINIYLPGGPPHLDMWDIKTEAPVEIRGEFNPIRTNVPGIEICEHFPRMARMADKFIFIRSVVESQGDHDGYQCMTGRRPTPMTRSFWPMMGSWYRASRARPTRRFRPTSPSCIRPASAAGATPIPAASSAWGTIRSTSSAARAAWKRAA